MIRFLLFSVLCTVTQICIAQNVMTPELLWQLGRVSGVGITDNGEEVVYRVATYNAAENSSNEQLYAIRLANGNVREIADYSDLISDVHSSEDGTMQLIDKEIKVQNVLGSEIYDDLDKSDVQIYDDLMYRHWDKWADGSYNHVLAIDNSKGDTLDIMAGQPYHCPTRPFGDKSDYLWHPNGKSVIYVTKQKSGINYATSTNTDIFQYDLETGTTTNLTESHQGYDVKPSFSTQGLMAWLSMARDGYEADKNDILVAVGDKDLNLTSHWDGTVSAYNWSQTGEELYFIAPTDGTKQLFTVNVPAPDKPANVRQITTGQFDVNDIIGQHGNALVVSRTDMNHASELFTVNLATGRMRQLTHVNDSIYGSIHLSKVEKRMVPTSDGKDMLTWVIYPPNFDPSKEYPTLLYCQGGPQGALSQFYSFRWNFQLMAANGYIVVAPNRRGMPGHGVEWNEQISKDWGGQNMQDYVSAIDDMAKEPYVDNEKLACVGASYGGYSAFYLAGIHEGRFKSFIAHDGVFNLRSMYGTTEELFFVNWDLGGPYWDKDNAAAQKTYREFNPINFVDKWDTPMLLIQGGMDFRVPVGQGLEAFQALRTRGIKSKLLYFPTENHWILSAQNGLVWQREFFSWLRDTLSDKS